MKQIDHNPYEKRPPKWIWKAAWAVVALLWFKSSAFSLTAAELMQAERNFASGYVLGAIEYRVNVEDADNPNFYRIRNCLISANATSGTFLDVVRRYIERHPETLTMSAISSVIKATNEMCPAGQ